MRIVRANLFCGNAAGNPVFRHVPDNHGVGTDDGIVPDADVPHHLCAGSDPDAIADDRRFCIERKSDRLLLIDPAVTSDMLCRDDGGNPVLKNMVNGFPGIL